MTMYLTVSFPKRSCVYDTLKLPEKSVKNP